jgi:hypothetical protein
MDTRQAALDMGMVMGIGVGIVMSSGFFPQTLDTPQPCSCLFFYAPQPCSCLFFYATRHKPPQPVFRIFSQEIAWLAPGQAASADISVNGVGVNSLLEPKKLELEYQLF